MIEDLYNEQEDFDAQDIEDINPENDDPNATYQFATGDIAPSEQLDAFMEEFAVAKEEKDAPDEPTQEELEELETGDIEDEEEISSQTARNTAQFLVATIDEGASIGLAYLSKDPQENFRAGKEQKKNLENLFAKFCKEKSTEIPLPWQIFFCLATIYGAKVPYALDRRKLNQEKQELDNIRKQLEEDRNKLNRAIADIESERSALRSIRETLNEKKKNG